VAHIEVTYGKQIERRIQLDAPRLVVGRGVGADLVLHHTTVSRIHCEIFERHGQHYVRDLMSTNSVQLGDDSVPAALLRNADEVAVGPFVLRYRAEDAPGLVEDRPAGAHWPGLGEEQGSSLPPGVQLASDLVDAEPDTSGDKYELAEKYKATALANPKQLDKLRQKVAAEQSAHLKIRVGKELHTLPLPRTMVVGWKPGHDLTLPNKPWLGSVAFTISKQGDAWLIERGSIWNGVRVGGSPLRKTAWLDDGDWIRCRGVELRFFQGS
jgi:pSer/pThr/pTyr-binding forkhead associated (FHA) protein